MYLFGYTLLARFGMVVDGVDVLGSDGGYVIIIYLFKIIE